MPLAARPPAPSPLLPIVAAYNSRRAALLTKELAEGLEPTTSGLQNRCSTIELRQRSVEMVSIESRQNPCKLFFRRRLPLALLRRCLTAVHHSVFILRKDTSLGYEVHSRLACFFARQNRGIVIPAEPQSPRGPGKKLSRFETKGVE